MKSRHAYILLFLLLAPAMCFMGGFMVQKHWHRAVLNKSLPKDSLVLMRFDSNDATFINWEGEDEFEWQGKMFDVVFAESNGDTFLFWCLEDNEETSLNRRLEKLINEQCASDPMNRSRGERVSSFYDSLFFVQPLWSESTIVGTHLDNFNVLIFNYCQGYLKSEFAPPEILIA